MASTGGASSSLVFKLTVTDPEGLSASDECSVAVNGTPPAGGNNIASGADIAGQWLSLTRSVNWWSRTLTFRGKIRVKNLGSQTAPSSVLYVYQSADATLQNTDRLLGKSTVPSIAGGAYADVSLTLTAPYSRSRVYIIGILDAANAFVEANETNNAVVSGLIR